MADSNDNKKKRIARWERKQKRSEQEQRIRKFLKDRKRQRKADRGVKQILRFAPNKRSGTKYREAVERLWCAARVGVLLKYENPDRPGSVRSDSPYLFAIAQLADRYEYWQRDPVDFRPRSQAVDEQFSALVRHLFARFETPAFLEKAWFEADPRKARRHQTWYIELGSGHSPRRLSGLPVELSKRAAHLLAEVPAIHTVEQGLRWAQIRAMGASPELANAMLATPIGTDFAHGVFWLTVVRFLIDQPMLELDQVGSIVDYIHHQRHQPQWVYDDEGNGTERPLQPDFSMAGRSFARLRRQAERWHREFTALEAEVPITQWAPSGFRGKRWAEGVGINQSEFVVRELLSTTELLSESGRMHHCVGTYASRCKDGESAIFALTCTQGMTTRSLLTIEVDPKHRKVEQVRGKCNKVATDEEKRLVRHWAAHARLRFADWVWDD